MSARTAVREHGTPARYNHGPDENDAPGKGCRCGGCTEAARVAAAERRESPDYRERQRLKNQAYNRATKTLRARHAEEFTALCAAERGETVDPIVWSVLTEADAPLEQMQAEAAAMARRVTPVPETTDRSE